MLVLRIVSRHPILALLSFYATIRSFTLAKKYFPKSNSLDGIGNAFRHALWCCLILMYCCKVTSPKKAVRWCKRITDLHEEIFPNPPLQNKMDLHNNAVGITLFQEILTGVHRQFVETSFFVDQLFKKTKTARKLTDLNTDYGDDLVFIDD